MRGIRNQSRAFLPFASAALLACGGGGAEHEQGAAVDSLATSLNKLADTTTTFKKVGHQYGPPTGKIRIANLLEIDGHPSGPLDFYEMRKPDSAAVPIIKGLKYGEISDYVSPRAEGTHAGAESWLYLFPAGLKQATRPFGGNIDNGFNATDQLTIALGPSKGFSGGASISLATIAEGGKKLDAAHADSETAIQGSQALLIVRDANSGVDSLPEQYLMVDGACPHASNDGRGGGDKKAFAKEPSSVTTTLLYPVSAGAHTLGVVTSPRGKGLQTCTGHSPAQTTSLNVEAGRRYVVWVFGQPSDGVKVVAAPIAPR